MNPGLPRKVAVDYFLCMRTLSCTLETFPTPRAEADAWRFKPGVRIGGASVLDYISAGVNLDIELQSALLGVFALAGSVMHSH